MAVSLRYMLLLVALLCAAPGGGKSSAGDAVAQALQHFEVETLVIRAGGKEHRFRVEVARTPRQQAQGLMYRRRMAADAGMLFLHPSPRRASMWMKDTYIPLDMLFLAPDGRIDQIVERTTPRSLATIVSVRPVAAVLELNAGTASRLGLKPGDRVVHRAFAPPG